MIKMTAMMLVLAAALVTLPQAVAGPSAASPEVKKALAKADQGPDALRRFIQRTRMIYALDYMEVIRLHEAQKAAGARPPAADATASNR